MKSDQEKRAHLHLFLKIFVVTQDEHDPETPFKRLPVLEMPHLLEIADAWVANKMLVVAKSRQLMITWLFCACLLWDTMFFRARLNILISKKEEDADATLNRAKGIYARLPEIIKAQIPAARAPKGDLGSYCRFAIADNESRLIAMSQKPDDVRQYTCSNILFDEMAFQDRAEDCLTAIMPAIRKGGKVACVSTPYGKNFFYKLFAGAPENGFKSVRLHYSQVPMFNTKEWKDNAMKGYVSKDKWDQEMEINFMKAGTSQMYPMFNYSLHVRDDLKVIRERRLVCGVDFGFHRPALVVAQVSPLDQLVVLAELMGRDITIKNFAQKMLQFLHNKFPFHFQERRRLIEWYCDPAGNQVNDKSEMTSVQLIRKDFGIYAKWQRVGIKEGVRLLQHLMNSRVDNTTGFLIDSSCNLLIEGFQGGYQEQKTHGVNASKELPLSDEHYSHTQDALRYIAVNKFPLTGRFYKPKPAFNDSWDPLEDDNYFMGVDNPSNVTGYSL